MGLTIAVEGKVETLHANDGFPVDAVDVDVVVLRKDGQTITLSDGDAMELLLFLVRYTVPQAPWAKDDLLRMVESA